MSKVHWIANALPVKQVYTITITADDATTIYKVTINGKVVSVLGTGTGVNNTAAALQAALTAATIPEFLEIAWTVSTATVMGTAVTAGKPFTAVSAVSGGSGTVSASATVANTGPNNWDNTANWDTGALPTNSDDVYFDLSTAPCLYGIDQNTITLASLNIPATYTGTIGLPLANGGGYYEYRNRALKISATNVNIGYGPGAGSSFINLNTGSNATTIIARMGRAQNNSTPALLWVGSHTGSTFELLGGSAGAAFYAGDTCRAAFIVGGSSVSDCSLVVGPGATIDGWTQTGGTAEINSNVTTVTKTGGQLTVTSGAITTLDNLGGSCIYNSTSTLTTGIIGSTATLDFSQDVRAKTVTNPLQAYKGATIVDPNHVALACGITPVGCKITDVTLQTTYGKTWTPA